MNFKLNKHELNRGRERNEKDKREKIAKKRENIEKGGKK